MATMNSVNERVEAGAAWLDRVDPKWIDRIDIKQLDLACSCNCVLGQIVSNKTGDDLAGYDEVVAEGAEYPWGQTVEKKRSLAPRGVKGLVISLNRAKTLGFHTEGHADSEWRDLTRAWKALIKNRRSV